MSIVDLEMIFFLKWIADECSGADVRWSCPEIRHCLLWSSELRERGRNYSNLLGLRAEVGLSAQALVALLLELLDGELCLQQQLASALELDILLAKQTLQTDYLRQKNTFRSPCRTQSEIQRGSD